MTDLNANVIIQGEDFGHCVLRVHRGQFLCSPSQNATIDLNPSCNLLFYPSTSQVLPAMSVEIHEMGVKTFTGYVVQVVWERTPVPVLRVECVDTYHRVIQTFLTEKLTTTEGFNTDYWAGQILSQTGISYSVDAPSASVPPGVELGLRMAHEALFDICVYASWYMYVDADGVLHLTDLTSPAISESITNWIEFGRGLGTEQTRSVIKVYGQGGLGPLGRDRIFAKASRSITGVDPDLVAAVASPLIATQAEAQRVANYMLTELGTLTDIKSGVAIGSPSRRVGQRISLTHSGNNFSFSGTDVLTTLESELSEKGYVQDMKLGEKCPRIAGWSRATPPIYAGTSGSGVFRSVDGGITWTDFNTGLPTGTKYVRRLAANSFDEVMSIVNRQLWKRPSGASTWTGPLSLPAPTNDAGDSPAPSYGRLVAVDAVGAGFALLTSTSGSSTQSAQRNRAWVYETQDLGETWASAQLYSGTSGSGYNLIGHDLSSRYGTVYAVTTSGSAYEEDACPMLALVGDMRRTGHKFIDPNTCCCAEDDDCGDVPDVGIWNWDFGGADQTGAEPDRTLEITIRVHYTYKRPLLFGTTTLRITTWAHVVSGFGENADGVDANCCGFASPDGLQLVSSDIFDIVGSGGGYSNGTRVITLRSQSGYAGLRENVYGKQLTVAFSFRFIQDDQDQDFNIVWTGEYKCPDPTGPSGTTFYKCNAGLISYEFCP